MDDFKELLNETQKVSKKSQEQTESAIKPKADDSPTKEPENKEPKPKKLNIKQNVFITNAKNVKTKKRKLQ